MKCPHCTVEISPTWNSGHIEPEKAYDDDLYDDEARRLGNRIETAWCWQAAECPSCRKSIIFVSIVDVNDPYPPLREYIAYPPFSKRKNISDTVPKSLREEYEEACRVLPVSSKASVALSRRLLQAVLEERGYESKYLAQQIDAALEENSPDKILPSSIRQKIDAVRWLGNFAAHPISDRTTLEVISVEFGEAEWCLEIIEELFDHYYGADNKEDDKQIALLNKKLRRVGKPEIKS